MDDDSLARLTRTQRQYLAMVSLGLSSKEIARLTDREPSAIDTACKRAGATTGVRDRFALGRLLAEQEPELIQSVAQRFGLTAKALAELSNPPPGERVAPIERAERRWNDLAVWQKRVLAVVIAFGTLAIGTLLLALSRHVLLGASRL